MLGLSVCLMLGPGPCGIPGNRQAEPLPIGRREGPHHSPSRKWSAPRGRSRLCVLGVCLQQGAALPAGGFRGDLEDIWAGPAGKGSISACGDGESLFQAEQTARAQAGQWEDVRVGAKKSLPLCILHPITPNFVLSDPPAPSALTL